MNAFEKYPRVSPFLWFESNAEEAVDFYLTIFRNSRRLNSVPGGGGKALTVGFELDGLAMTALNGGPSFKFTEAISLVVRCDTQEEIDYYWGRLSEGGSEGQCGWLKDKFGLSWQVTPSRLPELIRRPKAMQAMLTMKKIDLAVMERAAEG